MRFGGGLSEVVCMQVAVGEDNMVFLDSLAAYLAWQVGGGDGGMARIGGGGEGCRVAPR